MKWARTIIRLIAEWYGIKVSAPAVMCYRLLRSVLWMRFRKHLPHDWVQTSLHERQATKIYAKCSRCGAKR